MTYALKHNDVIRDINEDEIVLVTGPDRTLEMTVSDDRIHYRDDPRATVENDELCDVLSTS